MDVQDDLLNKITTEYDKLTYLDQYGGSFILFIIITIIVIILISYFHLMINAQPIINDWPNQRCKPTIIPIAGWITHPEDMTASEYTYQNFNYCSQNILSGITGEAVKPLTYITSSLQTIANDTQNSIQSVRSMFDKIRTSMQNVSEEIMGRLMNITIPIIQMIISFRDLIGKIQGTMTASLFTALGSYYTLQTLMGSIAQSIVSILIALAAMIAAFWAVPVTWGAAAANTVIFAGIAIPMSIILAFMSNTLHIKGYQIPTVKCFDKNTLITMNNGKQKKIIDINVGDVLINNNVVTSTIKVVKYGSIMYKLNNVIVSDSHKVKYNNNWINVSNHPHAIMYEPYNEEFLYCLNTSCKIIEINNIIFSDWDEIYDETLDKVINNTLVNIHNTYDIHKYLECGFSKYTKVRLQNGTFVNINKLNINDILENGEKVYGLVKINGYTLNRQFAYNLGKNIYIEGYFPKFNFDKINIKNKHKTLYHILTDSKTFNLYNTVVSNYNDYIDKFL